MTAADPAASPAVDASSLWSEAAQLYRRICLLRYRGQSVEAARLQSTELSRTLSALGVVAGKGADFDSRLRALFLREEERVADASVLAEVLLPLLRETIPASRKDAASAPTSIVGSPRLRHSPPASARGIADFIDEMLQLERPAPSADAP